MRCLPEGHGLGRVATMVLPLHATRHEAISSIGWTQGLRRCTWPRGGGGTTDSPICVARHEDIASTGCPRRLRLYASPASRPCLSVVAPCRRPRLHGPRCNASPASRALPRQGGHDGVASACCPPRGHRLDRAGAMASPPWVTLQDDARLNCRTRTRPPRRHHY